MQLRGTSGYVLFIPSDRRWSHGVRRQTVAAQLVTLASGGVVLVDQCTNEARMFIVPVMASSSTPGGRGSSAPGGCTKSAAAARK